MHAEIEAMKKAKDKGLRGGKAVLMVDGKKVYVFKEDEINKVKNGGKKWKNAYRQN